MDSAGVIHTGLKHGTVLPASELQTYSQLSYTAYNTVIPDYYSVCLQGFCALLSTDKLNMKGPSYPRIRLILVLSARSIAEVMG